MSQQLKIRLLKIAIDMQRYGDKQMVQYHFPYLEGWRLDKFYSDISTLKI